MAPQDKYLLPPPSELQVLSDEMVRVLVSLADAESRRRNLYANLGMICGTVSFLGSLGAYVYLVGLNHEAAAAVVLGATVLAVISTMIKSR